MHSNILLRHELQITEESKHLLVQKWVEVSIRCTRDYKEIRIINDQGWYCHLCIGRYNNF